MNSLDIAVPALAIGSLITLSMFGVRQPQYTSPARGDDAILSVRHRVLWSHSFAGAFALCCGYYIVSIGTRLAHGLVFVAAFGLLLGRIWGWWRLKRLCVVDPSGPDGDSLPESKLLIARVMRSCGSPVSIGVAPPLPMYTDIGVALCLQVLGFVVGYLLLWLLPD